MTPEEQEQMRNAMKFYNEMINEQASQIPSQISTPRFLIFTEHIFNMEHVECIKLNLTNYGLNIYTRSGKEICLPLKTDELEGLMDVWKELQQAFGGSTEEENIEKS
jgi:hypothetical protein